jgi:transposase
MGIEQQLKELEKRRKRGMRLLAEGFWPAEVARRVGVTRQSVLRWTKLTEQGGIEALKRPELFGRPPKLDDAQRAELIKTLKAGALAARFVSELWTLPRIASMIKERFGVELSQPSVWRMLQQLGWSYSDRRVGRASATKRRSALGKRWPGTKNRIIVFIDESGLSERPAAHATTNALLTVLVIFGGQWQFW